MLEALLKQRQDQYERRIRDLSYDLAVLHEKASMMEKALSELSGAVYEIDQVLKDIQTAQDAEKEKQDDA